MKQGLIRYQPSQISVTRSTKPRKKRSPESVASDDSSIPSRPISRSSSISSWTTTGNGSLQIDQLSLISSIGSTTTYDEANRVRREKSSVELLNVEVLKLNKERDTWRDERLQLEDMVHLAVKEKLAIQESIGEGKLQQERLEVENIELRKGRLQSDQMIESLRTTVEEEHRRTQDLIAVNAQLQTAHHSLVEEHDELLFSKESELTQLRDELKHANQRITEQSQRIKTDSLEIERLQHLKDENFGLQERVQGAKEIKGDLLRATKSNERTIESLIERTKALELKNGELRQKCFEGNRLINDLGMSLATLQDIKRELTTTAEQVPELQSRIAELERINDVLLGKADRYEKENDRLMVAEAKLKMDYKMSNHELGLLEQASKTSSSQLNTLRETEVWLNDRINGKNDIIKQQSNQIASLTARIEPLKQLNHQVVQTSALITYEVDCQTSLEVKETVAKTLSDQATQTAEFDQMGMIRKYRKRNRQLEIAYEKSAKSLNDKKLKLNGLMTDNNQLRKSCDIYRRLIQDEQIKVEEAHANAKVKLWAKDSELSNIQTALDVAKKASSDMNGRLHLAELSQARMLRRVREAEQKSSHLRTALLEQQKRRETRNTAPSADFVDKQVKTLRAKLKVLNRQVDQYCTIHTASS